MPHSLVGAGAPAVAAVVQWQFEPKRRPLTMRRAEGPLYGAIEPAQAGAIDRHECACRIPPSAVAAHRCPGLAPVMMVSCPARLRCVRSWWCPVWRGWRRSMLTHRQLRLS